jgi:hypothetical protein
LRAEGETEVEALAIGGAAAEAVSGELVDGFAASGKRRGGVEVLGIMAAHD